MALEDIFGDEQEPQGGLGAVAQAPQPNVDHAIATLNQHNATTPRNIFDDFRDRVMGLPTPADVAKARAASQAADDRARAYYRNAQIDRGLPWIQFAAGMLKPTRTGSFGESFGSGLEGYAAGTAEANKQQLALQTRGAESDAAMQRKQYEDIMREQQQGFSGMSTLARLRQANDLLLKPRIVNQADVGTFAVAPDPQDPNNPEKFKFKMLSASPKVGMLLAKIKADLIQKLPKERNYATPQDLNADVENEMSKITKLLAQGNMGEVATRYGVPNLGAQQPPFRAEVPGVQPQPAPGNAQPVPGQPQPSPQPAPGAAPESPITPVDLPSYVLSKAPPQTVSRQPGVSMRDPVQDATRKEQMKVAAEDYQKSVLPHVAGAEKIKAAILNLNEVDPATSPVAGLVSALGKAGSVIGLPADNALVREATKINTGQKVVEALRNDLLLLAKGVQTEGDAQRALQQIASMNDMKEVFVSTKALMSGLAQRAIEKQNFYNTYAMQNGGSYVGAAEAWSKNSSDVPIIKKVKFKSGREGFVTYNQYIEERLRAGHSMEDIMRDLKK